MSLQAGILSNFAWRVDSIGTTRPAAAMGVSITPGTVANTEGSYGQVFSALARDVWFLSININSGNTAATARDTHIDIGVDAAGGTSYTAVISDLLAPCASALGALSATAGHGIWYHFPLRIPAGATVGARASCNATAAGALRVRCIAYGSPKNRELARAGTYVTSYGIGASSNGTTVTSGTTSEGSWTSLGSITRKAWWWQAGFGVSDSTMSAVSYYMDLGIGDGTNKFVVIENEEILTSASECVSKHGVQAGCVSEARASGDTVYGRLQCSGNADSNLSMAAYGLGG